MTITPQEQPTYWAVQVYGANGKWIGRLAPSGFTTRLRVHAARIPDRAKAEEVAAEITEQNPDLTAKAVEF